MNKPTTNRLLGVALTLVLAISMLVMPASAAPPQGTASIDTPGSPQPREVFAGTASQPFDVTLNNPGLADGETPTTVDWVMLLPPPDDYTVTALSAPGDWEGRTFSDGRVIFTGDTLAGGDSATFHVEANVSRPDTDVALPWRVLASDDGGETATQYQATSDGALTPVIRVLNVAGNRLTGPDGVLDGDATEGQTVTGALTVANLGSATLTVRPELSGNGFTAPDITDAVSIASGATVDVPWSVQLGEPGSAQVTGDATADEGATAPTSASTDTLEVLSRAEFEYVNRSLSPRFVVPGSEVSFRLQLRNLGEVSVDSIDLDQTRLEFAGGAFSAPLAAPASVGGDTSALFEFAPTEVSTAIADDEYAATVRLVGTDQNGVAVSQQIDVAQLITVDSTIPEVDVAVDLPDSQVKGESAAATSGVTFGVSGTVEDGGQPCGACDVAGRIQEFDAAGNRLLDPPASVEVTNDGGDLSASIDHTFTEGAVQAEVTVSAVDEAQLAGSGSTSLFEVDIVEPRATSATTGGPDGDDPTRVDIRLDERVFFPDAVNSVIRPGDFQVEGHTVTSVRLEDNADINQNDDGTAVGDQIVLGVNEPLGEDATPQVSFQALALSERPSDRVGLELDDFELTAADGILPRLPELDSVGGLGRLDGQFFVNDATPDVTVGTVSEGHRVEVFEDVNGNDLIDSQDRRVGRQTVENSGTVTITLDDLGANDRTLTLLTRATDGAGNVGPTVADVLTLDFTAPAFSSIEVADRDVQVGFSESLRAGRNAVADWTVETTRNGRRVFLAHDRVSGADDTATRTIHISEDDDQFDGSVSRVNYIFTGPDGQRYIDRAGNVLVDFAGTP